MDRATNARSLRLHRSVNRKLPGDIYKRIRARSAEGDELIDNDDFSGAERAWLEALELLPEPASEWDAYTRLWALIGDARYMADHDDEAVKAFDNACSGPGGMEDPWIRFMLGKALVHAGNRTRAVEELLAAYRLDGADLFEDDFEGETMLQIVREAGVGIE